jgi:hypothetical protein
VFVEFSATDGTPYQVLTQEPHAHGLTCHDYGFDLSKKYGLLYHYLGMGPAESTIELHDGIIVGEDGTHIPIETIYWAAPGIAVKECSRCKRLDTLPEKYTPEKLFDGWTAMNCEYGVIWCSECDDCFPDNPADYCEHVWECFICDVISTPDERCGHERGAEEEDREPIAPGDYRYYDPRR